MQRLQDADVGLAVDAGQDHRDEVARAGLGTAHHVPGRGPAQRTGERLDDGADVGPGRGQRPFVEPDPGVRQVIVVEQDQCGLAPADERGHLGTIAHDVEFHPVDPDKSGARGRRTES